MNKKEIARAKAINAFQQANMNIQVQISTNKPVDWTELLAAKTALELVDKLEEEENCSSCQKVIDPTTEDYALVMFNSIFQHKHKTQIKEELARGINGFEIAMCQKCAKPFINVANKTVDSLLSGSEPEKIVKLDDGDKETAVKNENDKETDIGN